MKNEKFYILKTGEENELGMLSDESYQYIVENKDPRVSHIDGWYIIVKAAHKYEVESEYKIKLKGYGSDFVTRMYEYGEVGNVISDITSNNELLSSFWSSKTLSDSVSKKIYRDTVNIIYSMTDEEALECILSNSFYSFMEKPVKTLMYKIMIQKLQDGLKEIG